MNTFTTIDPEQFLLENPNASNFSIVMETPEYIIVRTTQGWRNANQRPLDDDTSTLPALNKSNLAEAYWEAAQLARYDPLFLNATALRIVDNSYRIIP